jgi:hypothetical protein
VGKCEYCGRPPTYPGLCESCGAPLPGRWIDYGSAVRF